MRTYDEAFAAATDGSPFSNGTEGHAWQANWCCRCLHDQSVRRDDVQPDPRNNGLLGCALVGVALTGKTPSEWLEQDRSRLGDQYHCIEFRDEDDPGPGYEPQPDPPLPGQLDLFSIDDQPRVRMFADAVIDANTADVMADEIHAALADAGCTWPVDLCPCTRGNCPVRLGAESAYVSEPPIPPYGTPERAAHDVAVAR